MGNSEVGHLNLGGGRIVYQDYTRISLAVENGSFGQNPVLLEAMAKAQKTASCISSACSPTGGCTATTLTFMLFWRWPKRQGLMNVYVHAILDGRDVPPSSALTYFRELEEKFEQIGTGKVATVSGRYYTMDRDKRWDRVEKAYRCLTDGVGCKAETAKMPWKTATREARMMSSSSRL